jgi:broad specificity phosphatase PhoE
MGKDILDIDFGDDEDDKPVVETEEELPPPPKPKRPILLVIRHGNTFEAGEPPRRIGARTDLVLTAEGRAQMAKLRQYLEREKLMPQRVYASPLQRTLQSAAQLGISYEILEFLREIYHGMDENKTEDVVLKNVGSKALKAWDEDGKLPPGWTADILGIRQGWAGMKKLCKDSNEIWAAVTSNGIARFVFEGVEGVPANRKLSTGAFGLLVYEDGRWVCEGWNIRP